MAIQNRRFICHMCLFGAVMLLGACDLMRPRHTAPPVTSAPAARTPTATSPMPAPATPVTPMSAPITPSRAQPAAPAARPKSAPHKAAPEAPAIKKAPAEEKTNAETATSSVAEKAQISGHVDLRAARGQRLAAGEQVDTLVYFVPRAGGARAKPGHYTIATHHRDFSPAAMAVPQGSTVTFVNLDDVRHNVFSVTPGAAFNLGYQAGGRKIAHVFTHAGLVLVSCNVHHSMELDLLVVPSPYSTKVGADGNFTLSGLPEGAGTLHFWNPRAQPASQAVSLPMSGTVKQVLQAFKPRMATQLNTGAAP